MSDAAPSFDTTKSRLIAAASAEIRLIGAKRMTVSGIAASLGMSHANVYRFFADKTALIDAALNAWLRVLEMRLSEIVDGPDPADDKLERFLTTLARAYADALRQDPAIFRLLALPEAHCDEPVRHRRRVQGFVSRVIEEGMATRLFGGQDAARLASLALDLSHRFIDPSAMLLSDDGSAMPEARRDRTIRWAIRAITSQQRQ